MMKDKLQTTMKRDFDRVLADGVKSILFKNYLNTYDIATGDNARVASDVSTRGLVNQVTEAEINKSDGRIKIDDLKVTIISSELIGAPKINDICDIEDFGEHKVSMVNIDAWGASYVLRVSKENG